ncbi:MAG: hypothetical protein LAP21_12880 [Acidobacteriia bacterium]|nr:hypothetical protein [Terriglobia bacterium]
MPNLHNKPQINPPQADGGQHKKKEFQLVSVGDGQAWDGTALALSLYRSSDGTKVTVVHGRFESVAGSDKEMLRETQQALRILEQTPKKDVLGVVVGQRVVLIFSKTKVLPERAAVLWTDGIDYFQIVSPELNTALEFEKQFKY